MNVRAKGDAAAISKKLNGAFRKTVGSDAGVIEIDCPVTRKMDLLRALADCGTLCTDVEVRPPTLDDLYLHFSGRPIAAPAGRD